MCCHTCDRSSEATTLTLYWRNSTRCLLKAKRLSANFTGATGFNQRICHNAYTKEPVHILKLHQLQAIWHSTKNNNHPKHNMENLVTESCRKTQFCSNHVWLRPNRLICTWNLKLLQKITCYLATEFELEKVFGIEQHRQNFPNSTCLFWDSALFAIWSLISFLAWWLQELVNRCVA